MNRRIAIILFLGLWACIANAQNLHLICMDIPIDGTIGEMELKFYDNLTTFSKGKVMEVLVVLMTRLPSA